MRCTRAIRQTARTGWLTWLAILAVTAPVTSPAWADDPPATVYRYDSRPPEDVFQNGFTAWGNNDNVLEHLTGRSCQVGSSNSAFVSTSSSRRYTEVYLEHRMQEAVEAERAGRGTGHFIGYIYEVRADNNFYGAASSYFEYVDTYGDNAGRILAGALATYQSEYLAHRRIPPENIRRVTRVYHNGITGETTTTEYPNARYVSQQTRANPNPYTSRRSVASIVGTLVRMAPVTGACMARQAESPEAMAAWSERAGEAMVLVYYESIAYSF
ncbi:pertussis toxin ADP-ribosyltransferase subunit S1 [Bordetella bronchiseptica]|uniref:Pertussis toxin subunit 1 homolog n=1 Tax=Bordetella bronchiseptica (strain ATCC BAA-588 / NCTC 13252 / RB50) TaxID=257310 RepID=TOX1_BORBR|nr:pertussis toxin ADP-ribosyltransferase subunit S1 [Bordetella bronchiseptica]Q7WDU8.1 RecName: Full=Pertussis toxin subunit 1 homolog; Flags: Precursor [Bordetella bronchiseptica RB50]pir/A25973/ pertussis toxin chain S1 precursor - Bordetella bronchiseptica [Bordetella bronchiseptica]KAK63410.1 pertussis toxin subunit 1 [Bordetella bronchiseptica 980-2]KDD57855.1 pertussis toxin subunit 1 [Bordetella bronchiseptica OSU553]AMG86516.1 pertussis toxin subunit 1 [Bordetella bronchiseptica]AWP